MRAFALARVSDAGSVQAGLPVVEVTRLRRRRWVSLPYTDRLDPLFGPAGGGRTLRRCWRPPSLAGVDAVELRSALPGAFAEDAAWLHLLRLDPDPTRWRRACGRTWDATSARPSAWMSRSPAKHADDLVGPFYRLHVATRRRQGVPVQPRRFFSLFWQRLAEPGLATVLLGRVDGRPVAGAVFLTWNGTTIYKFGASDPAFAGYRVNNLLMWRAIRDACAAGSHTFDFGRTDDDNEGLRAFKRSWGAEEQRLTYSTLAAAAPGRGSHRVEGLLGATLRRSPPWMTRVAGELLYRFAA